MLPPGVDPEAVAVSEMPVLRSGILDADVITANNRARIRKKKPRGYL